MPCRYEIRRATDYNLRAQIMEHICDLDGRVIVHTQVSSDYTIQYPNEVVMVDSLVGPITITLPPSPAANDYVGVWDDGKNAAVNNITIVRNGNTITNLEEDMVIDMNDGRFDLIWAEDLTPPPPYVTTGKLVEASDPDFESYDRPSMLSSSSEVVTFAAFLRMPSTGDYQQHTIVTNTGMFFAFHNWYDNSDNNNNIMCWMKTVSTQTGSGLITAGRGVHGISSGDWFALMYSIDYSGIEPVIHVWTHKKGDAAAVDIAAAPVFVDNATGPINLDLDSTSSISAVGSHPSYGPEAKTFEVSEFYMTDEFVDWSDPLVRAKYVDSTGKPVGLGSDGSSLTGTAAKHYASGADLTNNLGTEDNWTEVGTIENSATSPSDEVTP